MEDIKGEAGSVPNYSKEEERKALRKLDWTLIPLSVIEFLVSSASNCSYHVVQSIKANICGLKTRNTVYALLHR